MDGVDHNKKNGSSGHDSHDVHVCHKCGWPFPNPHPSAKHRRAHKKVCGTVEGYNNLNESDAHHPHLAASDDDRASDEDLRTPSPKIEKRSMRDTDSRGRVAQYSNASEDEVFTDAVTEFSDSGVSPGMEERVREMNKDVEKMLKTDPDASQQLSEADPTVDKVVSLDDTNDSSKEVPNIAKDQPENDRSSYGSRNEDFLVESHDLVGSKSSIKSETPANVLIEDTSAEVFQEIEHEAVVNENDVHMDESLTTSLGPHGKAARDVSNLEFNLEETSKQTSEALTQEPPTWKLDQERESLLEEAMVKSSGCKTLEALVLKDESDKVETNTGKDGTSPLVEGKKDETDIVADDDSVYNEIVEVYAAREEGKDDRWGNSSGKEQEEMNVSGLKDEKKKDKLQENDVYMDESLTTSSGPHGKAARDILNLEFNLEETGKQSSDALTQEPPTWEVDQEGESLLKEAKVKSSGCETLEALVPKDESDKVEANMGKNDKSLLVEGKKDETDLVADDDSVYNEIVEEGDDDMSGKGSGKEQEEMNVSGLKEEKEKDELQALGSIDRKEATSSNSPEEEDKNMHSQSVLNSLPAIHNGETVFGGAEDHNASESTLPLHNVASAGLMTSVQDDNNAPTGLCSGDSRGSIDSSSADTVALKDDPDEKAVERKGYISGIGHEDDRSCGLESLPDAPRNETQSIRTDCSSEGLHLLSTDSEALQKVRSQDGTADQLDIKCAVLDEEVEQITNLHEVENADNNEASKIQKFGATENETTREPLKGELSAKKPTIEGSFFTEDNQTTGSLRGDGHQNHDSATPELLDTGRLESTEVGGGANVVKSTEAAHDASGRLSESTVLDNVSGKVLDARGNVDQTHSRLDKYAGESSREASQGFGTSNITDVFETVGFTAKDVQADDNGILSASKENPENLMSREEASLHVVSEPSDNNSGIVELTDTREAVKSASDCNSKPLQDEGEHRSENQPDGVSAVDVSVASSSRCDSLECNWGSVSVVSTLSDATATADAGGLPFTTASQPPENSWHPDKSAVREPPSLVTSVESGDPTSAASEIQTAQNVEQPKREELEKGSQARKNNEEIIEKVSIHRSSTEKQHNPLKSFLSEAKSPDAEQDKGNSAAATTTVNAILHAEETNDEAVKKDMEKEWNSPARYPSQIKKERKKGRPYWVPFVCCSSVHRDF